MKSVSLALAAVLAALSTSLAAAAQESSILVTTEWLADRLGDPDVVVLHVGNADSYEEAHVPGARLMALPSFAPEVDGMSTEMPAPDAFRAALESAGVSLDSRIVVYSASHPPQLAARLYLTLENHGLGARASLLDGGLLAWRAEGRSIETGASEVVERGSLPALSTEASDLVVAHDYVNARLADGGAFVVDARDEPFWTGAQWLQARAERAGRVPGSVNLPFRTLVDDSGHLLAPDVLAERFAQAGIEPGAPIVAYCHVGQQASLVALAARLLGHEVRLYDGSYEDWSARPDLPVVAD